MQNILVVEDDYDLNQAICYSFEKVRIWSLWCDFYGERENRLLLRIR